MRMVVCSTYIVPYCSCAVLWVFVHLVVQLCHLFRLHKCSILVSRGQQEWCWHCVQPLDRSENIGRRYIGTLCVHACTHVLCLSRTVCTTLNVCDTVCVFCVLRCLVYVLCFECFLLLVDVLSCLASLQCRPQWSSASCSRWKQQH